MEKKYPNLTLTFLLEHEDAMGIDEHIRSYITGLGATLDTWDSVKMRRLAYPIKDLTEAYISAIRFSIDPSQTEVIKNALKKNNSLLRFMVLEWKKPPPRRKPVLHKTPPPEEQVPTDEKALDERLEEILGTPAL